jgi:hypothetical protein
LRAQRVPYRILGLKSGVAELATEKELLKEKIRHLEAGGLWGWWRSKR